VRATTGQAQPHRPARLETGVALKHSAVSGSRVRLRSGLNPVAFSAILNVPKATRAGLGGGASPPDGPLLRLLQILARAPTLLAAPLGAETIMNRLVHAILFLCLMVGMTVPVGGAGRTCAEFHAPLSAPDSVHIYLYAHGDPVNMVDPSGHFGIGSVSIGSIGATIGNIGLRVAISAPRITVLLFEATTGNTVILGGGTAVGTVAAMSRVQGGMASWMRLVQAMKGSVVGPYKAVASALARSGRQAHHINPTGIYPGIARNEGAAIDLAGSAFRNGTEHNAFHSVMNRFFAQFRRGGIFEGRDPTNRQVRDAMREAYEATGRFLDDQIDELMEFAEKEQRTYGYHDGPGGLPPVIPRVN
jgi:DNA-binding transcriptional regulator YiaG